MKNLLKRVFIVSVVVVMSLNVVGCGDSSVMDKDSYEDKIEYINDNIEDEFGNVIFEKEELDSGNYFIAYKVTGSSLNKKVYIFYTCDPETDEIVEIQFMHKTNDADGTLEIVDIACTDLFYADKEMDELKEKFLDGYLVCETENAKTVLTLSDYEKELFLFETEKTETEKQETTTYVEEEIQEVGEVTGVCKQQINDSLKT